MDNESRSWRLAGGIDCLLGLPGPGAARAADEAQPLASGLNEIVKTTRKVSESLLDVLPELATSSPGVAIPANYECSASKAFQQASPETL